jgi:hypothetical protein
MYGNANGVRNAISTISRSQRDPIRLIPYALMVPTVVAISVHINPTIMVVVIAVLHSGASATV